jgi:hypothetical protein
MTWAVATPALLSHIRSPIAGLLHQQLHTQGGPTDTDAVLSGAGEIRRRPLVELGRPAIPDHVVGWSGS